MPNFHPTTRAVAGIIFGFSLAVAVPAPALAQPEEQAATYAPDHLAAARSFIEATGADDLTEQVLEAFQPRVGRMIRTQHPKITDRQFDRFMELFTDAFREQRPLFRSTADRIYAGFISKQDLERGAEFYRSSAGRRFVEARPEIAQEMIEAGTRQMTMEHIQPHLSAEDHQAYKAFVDSELGKRLSAAQRGIRHVWVRFGTRIGLKVSGLAGTRAIRQMRAEGNGL